MAQIVMFHPDIPNSSTWMEQAQYRQIFYYLGWRSNDDAYSPQDSLTPGIEIDSSPLEADKTAFSAAGEIVAAADRVTVPLLGQPVLLEAWFQLASVTSVSTFSVAFAKLADVGAILQYKGARQYVSVPINGTAGLGTPVHISYRIPAGTAASDWTITGLRDSGTGTGQVKGNGIYGGLFVARAM